MPSTYPPSTCLAQVQSIQRQADAILARWPARIICAWCRLVLRDGPPDRVSHGICPKCAAAVEML